MLDLLVIGVLCLFFAKLKRTVVAKQRWRESDAVSRDGESRTQCNGNELYGMNAHFALLGDFSVLVLW
jgi:hypothetical protein